MYANKVDQKAPMDQDGAEEMKGFDVRRRRGAGGAGGAGGAAGMRGATGNFK